MQFFRINDFIIYLGSFFWVWAHGNGFWIKKIAKWKKTDNIVKGLPALIYLTMNKTIRRDIVQMLEPGRGGAITAKVGPANTQQCLVTKTAQDHHQKEKIEH